MTGGNTSGMRTPDASWLEATPDFPRFVEARSILLSGEGTVVGIPGAGFIVDARGELAAMLGRPDREALDAALGLLGPHGDVLAAPEGIGHLSYLLPGQRPLRAVLHLRPGPPAGEVDPSVEVREVDDGFVESLPPELGEEVVGARYAAVSRVGGEVVSVCGAFWPTETLWDVGIDTLPDYRRQGHAKRCFTSLDVRMGEGGRSPVWGAYEDNDASLGLAESLGFEAVDELWVVEL